MDLSTTLVVAAVTLLAVATALAWWLRRRAWFHSALEQRGWHLATNGDKTVVTPVTGDWTLTMSRSFTGQASPPGSHIVTSTWTCPTPATLGPVLIAGPTPPPDLRDLAADSTESPSPAIAQHLGLDRLTGGRPLKEIQGMDNRLLVFASDGLGPLGTLGAVADAITEWCSMFSSERDQPVLTMDRSGLSVRVRSDVLRSVEAADAFVNLSLRCRSAVGRP